LCTRELTHVRIFRSDPDRAGRRPSSFNAAADEVPFAVMSNSRPPVAYLSGVNDEPSADWNLDAGLDALAELGWANVALRAVDKQTVDAMSDDTYDRVCGRIRERGFAISSYLSMTVGRTTLDADDQPLEREKMRAAIRRAKQAGTRLIRAMGYYRGDCPGAERLPRTIARFRDLAAMAADANVVLGVEMCGPGWKTLGGSPYGLWRVLEEVGSPHLGAILDPGNSAADGEDPVQALELLVDHVVDVHVKDARQFGDRQSFCLAGDGVCEWPYLLRRLAEVGYQGPVTIEPHLQHAQQYHVTGPDGFVQAGRRIASLLQEANFECRTGPAGG
jgi:sugar phosphate isomerase/epimerase